MTIELLMNPFCLCERDYIEIRKICDKHNQSLSTYNLWDIDDDDLPKIPAHIANHIARRRNGEAPCSIYNDVFVNGSRVYIDKEDESYLEVEALIKAGLAT